MFSNVRGNQLVPIVVGDKFRNSGCNKVYAFVNARDEPNIAEWVAHHILLGFDKVIVYDHLSVEPIAQKLGTTFNGRLLVQRVDGVGNIKMSLMERAVRTAVNDRADWIIYLDADEFLLLNRPFSNVKDFLAKFSEADSIGINWLMFGTSGYVKQPKGLLTENFVRSDLFLNQHVKTFVRPEVVRTVAGPHHYTVMNLNRCFSAYGTKMRNGPFYPIPRAFFLRAPAYIAHFYTQSEEEHRRRKGRALDDGSSNKTGLLPEVHKAYNDALNGQLRFKYSDRIRNYLNENGIHFDTNMESVD